MQGYHHSPETKEICRIAAIKQWQDKTPAEKAYIITNQLTHRIKKGDKLPDSVKEKLRQANLGKKQSKETIAKCSRKIKIAMRGNKNGNKSVRCVETGVVFDSVKLAAESLGIAPSNITHCLKGEQKTAGTYHWVSFMLENQVS